MSIFNNLFKSEADIKDVKSSKKVEREELNLFGVIYLRDIDSSTDFKQLNDFRVEVELIKRNNEIKYLEVGHIKHKKSISLCKYFLDNIHSKVEELKRVQKISRGVLNSKKNNRNSLPNEKWLDMVNVIVELYPNVDLGKVDRIIKGKY